MQATRFVQERNLYTKVRSEEKCKTSKEAGEYYCSGTSKHKPSKHNCRQSSANSEQVSSNSKELQLLPQYHDVSNSKDTLRSQSQIPKTANCEGELINIILYAFNYAI